MAVDADMEDIVKEFLVESHEGLDRLDRDLVSLERDPSSRDTIASIFRTVHTIKGTCGFLGFGTLESVAHVGENLLSLLRDGKLRVNPEITTALLRTGDAVREMLASIEATGGEGDGDYSALIAQLSRLQEDDPAAPAASSTEVAAPAPSTPDEPAAVLAPEDEPAATPGAPRVAPATEPQHDGGKSRPAVSDGTIRVDVGLLDKLMDLVGELVLARNQILQSTTAQIDASLVATSQRLNLITTELQEGVMKTRMQPIANVWRKFPRVVRDLGTTCGKHVRLEMEGQDTELDKTIIESIKDPLTHLVRNAVDHGIESPEVRAAAGKPVEGRIVLRAFHEGGQVNIEMTDDGGGLDPERIKQKALQKGLVTPEQAARMSEGELTNLIFCPGFSTAERVTNLSGRGVGMDVVRTNIERIGGAVDLLSRVGRGTTIRIKIPLTLAIIPALIVHSAGERYAIPQMNLVELVRLDADQVPTGIEMIHGAPVYRLRGNLLPLVHLRRELRLEADAGRSGGVNIVVLQADDRQFGLVVDGISDTAEIVVKPLSKQLKALAVYAGATIMGDGRVALILDVLGLAQRAHVISEVRDRRRVEAAAAAAEDAPQTLLLVATGDGGQLAIPLSIVARLEEFARASVERAAGRDVVQYRGRILPLIRLSDALGYRSEERDPLQVVVYTANGRSAGVVVDCITDIVEDRITLSGPRGRSGVLGSAVVQQRVTDLLDLPAIIRSVDPTFFDEPSAA